LLTQNENGGSSTAINQTSDNMKSTRVHIANVISLQIQQGKVAGDS
jgi:hypothetical protein